MAALRVLQVDTCYPAYLRHLYTGNPRLRGASVAEQRAALIADQHAAIHRVGLHLAPFGHEVHWIVANAVSAQTRWLAEQGLPHEGVGEADMLDVTRRQIDLIAPDVLYTTDALLLDGAFIRSLARRPALTIGWHAAPLPGETDWNGYDLILSALSEVRRVAVERLGARDAEAFLPGFPTAILGGLPEVERRYGVVFAGQYTSRQHAGRARMLVAIAEQSARNGGDCAFCLSGEVDDLPPAIQPWVRPPVYGLAMLQFLRAGRIAFDARSEMPFRDGDQVIDLAGRETANMRIFEATGCGAMLLTERFDNVSALFRPGEEIETFGDVDELLDKLAFYRRHPERAEEIARRGQARCWRDHSMERRAADFESIIRRWLA